jgi:hypothetical protein
LLEYGEISYYFYITVPDKEHRKTALPTIYMGTNIQTIRSKLGGHRKTDFCVKSIHVGPCPGKWSLHF